MQVATIAPFVREAGQGLPVVCLHSNASSSSQWRALMERLSPSHRVVAIDSIGAGKSPPWPDATGPSLADEAAFIEPVLAATAAPFVLVGHSYGAAVALVVALARPERIRALGYPAPGTYADYSKLSSIKETAGVPKAVEMIRLLVEGQEAVVRTARSIFPVVDNVNDEPTADLLTQRMQVHEKTAWMLRSLLEQ